MAQGEPYGGTHGSVSMTNGRRTGCMNELDILLENGKSKCVLM